MEDIRVRIDGLDSALNEYLGPICYNTKQMISSLDNINGNLDDIVAANNKENQRLIKNDVRERFIDLILLVGTKFLTDNQLNSLEIRAKGNILETIKNTIDLANYIVKSDMTVEIVEANPKFELQYLNDVVETLEYMLSELEGVK